MPLDALEEKQIEYYKNTVLTEKAQNLKEFALSHKEIGISEFNKLINKILNDCFESFLRISGKGSLNELDKETKSSLSLYTVAALNNALPLNYPFIIAIMVFDDMDFLKFAVIKKTKPPECVIALPPTLSPLYMWKVSKILP